jgi:hydroxypyruvate reductase
MSDYKTLLSIWKAGVDAVNGRQSVSRRLAALPKCFTHVAAVGKAAPEMALGAFDCMGSQIPSLIVTKHGHGDMDYFEPCVSLIESSHPVPDETSLEAGAALLSFVSRAQVNAHLLFLVSGGASSLVEVLEQPHTLQDVAGLNERMLAEALDIQTMNARRRELSRIKGGRLLSAFSGRAVTVLAISDVPGDTIGVIGSGLADPSLCRAEGIEVGVVASNLIARNAAARAADAFGLEVVANSECLHGELKSVAENVASQLMNGPPGIYVFGGEPYLDLPDRPGEGGRNQALALAVAKQIDAFPEITFLAAGTDGGDGPGLAAGGFVSHASWGRTPGGQQAAVNADSGTWLQEDGGLIVTGPTGTNVMDLAIGWRA